MTTRNASHNALQYLSATLTSTLMLITTVQEVTRLMARVLLFAALHPITPPPHHLLLLQRPAVSPAQALAAPPNNAIDLSQHPRPNTTVQCCGSHRQCCHRHRHQARHRRRTLVIRRQQHLPTPHRLPTVKHLTHELCHIKHHYQHRPVRCSTICLFQRIGATPIVPSISSSRIHIYALHTKVCLHRVLLEMQRPNTTNGGKNNNNNNNNNNSSSSSSSSSSDDNCSSTSTSRNITTIADRMTS
jgi:hypothetical protein